MGGFAWLHGDQLQLDALLSVTVVTHSQGHQHVKRRAAPLRSWSACIAIACFTRRVWARGRGSARRQVRPAGVVSTPCAGRARNAERTTTTGAFAEGICRRTSTSSKTRSSTAFSAARSKATVEQQGRGAPEPQAAKHPQNAEENKQHTFSV